MKRVEHTIKPFYNKDSKVLILGSFPSVKSRESNFYYAHPQNQFWKILKEVFNEKIENKKEFLTKYKIALWDVIESCEIDGSKDSTIKNIKVNDIQSLIDNSNIKYIFTTGKKSYELYNKFLKDKTKIEAIYLPSTSPLYQVMKLEEKIKKYKMIKDKLINE